jgi:mono/diheme cytochrome c family protein
VWVPLAGSAEETAMFRRHFIPGWVALGLAATLVWASPVAGAQDAAPIASGEKVYAAQKCSLCHSVAGKGNKKNPLDGVGTKLSADDIRKWITHPDEMSAQTKSTKKPPMPKKFDKLPAADLDALVAYLHSLK